MTTQSSSTPNPETREGQEQMKRMGIVPYPVADDLTRPFWDAANRHKLIIQHCKNCGEYRHPPREDCPICQSTDVEWSEISGRGTVFTFIIDHRNEVPGFDGNYVFAFIIPEETGGKWLASPATSSSAIRTTCTSACRLRCSTKRCGPASPFPSSVRLRRRSCILRARRRSSPISPQSVRCLPGARRPERQVHLRRGLSGTLRRAASHLGPRGHAPVENPRGLAVRPSLTPQKPADSVPAQPRRSKRETREGSCRRSCSRTTR